MRKLVRLVGALIVVSGLSTCAEPGPGNDGPDLDMTELPTGPQVSNPVELTAASGITASRLQAESQEDLVYVSLPTGTVADGLKAAVRRAGDEVPIITTMQDGGFDPVAVRAGPTDTVEIVVMKIDGTTLLIKAPVKEKRPPTVVRTWPPRKKSDMPVNGSMIVVFSEPVDAKTVTSSSVRLFAGRSEIPGQVLVLDDGTSIALTPDAPLSPQREYRLAIGKTIADLEGETLDADVVVGFKTGTSTVGPPASIVVSPDSIVLLAGSTYQFSAKVFDADENLLLNKVTWHVTALDVLSISTTGLVTALQNRFIGTLDWAEGQVEARIGTLSASGFVAVVPQPGSIEIVPSAATLAIGDTLALEVVTRMSLPPFTDRILPPLTVSNSNPAASSISVPALSAIQVSPFRTLRALAPGTSRITIKAGGLSATSDITITAQRPVDTVRVAPATAEMAVQETLQFTAWLRDANGTNIQETRPVSWSSSNTSVVTVNGGQVTAVADGTATITATSEGKTSSASITVSAQPLAPKFIELTAKFWQTCAVTAAGDAYCWGRFSEQSATKDLRVPTLLPGGLDLVAMAPGNGFPGFFCGRANAGEAFCWNYYTSIPNRFAQTLSFSDLSVSDNGHACGVATDGSTYCWGKNLYGQLGDGTTEPRPGNPTTVIGGHAFKSVAVGRYHSCGLTVAGDAYCWGADADPFNGAPDRQHGSLGAGDATEAIVPTPRRVAGGWKFAQLSAGNNHTCGITTDGKAFCWGGGSGGRLGDGTGTVRSVPVAVQTSLTFTTISAGGSHTCAIATGGAAYCWGYNWYGELGVPGPGSLSDKRLEPVAVEGNLSFVRISAGALHSCGIATTGRLYCWGDNFGGQLGDGTTATNRPVRSSPTEVSRP